MDERIESKNTRTSLCAKCPRNVRVKTYKDGLCYFCMIKVHGKCIAPFVSGKDSGGGKNRGK